MASSMFVDLDEADFTGDSLDIRLEVSPESASEDEDGDSLHDVSSSLDNTVADIDLGTSLSTLISGEKPKDARPRRYARRRISSRIPLNEVRIISDGELERRTGKLRAKSNDSISCRRPKSPGASSTDGKSSIDLQTVTLAAAGISLVAGISFSAGYAIGRRSASLLRVTS